MKSYIFRTTFAVLLATSVGAGVVALTPTGALAHMSPANPNYTFNGDGGATDYGFNKGDTAFAQAPAAHTHVYNSQIDHEMVISDGVYLGQDPDPSVRLELRRDGNPSKY